MRWVGYCPSFEFCVCVCKREREREREGVCERERKREREGVCVCERERERERDIAQCRRNMSVLCAVVSRLGERGCGSVVRCV